MKKAAAIGNTMFIYLAALLPVFLFAYGKNAAITFMWQNFFSDNIFLPLFLLLLFGVFMYIVNILLLLKVRQGCWSAWELARANMFVKLAQIPAYIFIFIVGAVCMIMIFTAGITFLFVLLDAFSIGMTGLYGLAVFYKLRKEKYISTKMQIYYSLASFVFCVDVIAAIVGYRLCAREEKQKKLSNIR